MNDEEYRDELLASAASRAEGAACGLREAFVLEVVERLRDAGEIPDAESCPESHMGQRNRRLEVDAFAQDEADNSLHLFIALRDGGTRMPPVLTLTEARDQGFNRLLGVFEQSRDGWIGANVEESRPLWSLARSIRDASRLSALRLHVFSDRCISERLREIPADQTRDGTPVTFQIWDVTRLKRIFEARSVRDDLVVDFTHMDGGGLPVLRAAVGEAGYDAYLAVIPAEVLADAYIRHGSRLLEGNVRTFLGRRGNVNRGIAATLAREPERFFAYNNGIAATASTVSTMRGPGGATVIATATDLQIVNGAQTTASLAAARRERKTSLEAVFVPMKLSVVAPEVAGEMIPLISRYANSQNSVRASDFFANHEFHRRVQEISRRVLTPAGGTSQYQTHWYYERARGQHLNDQSGLTAARRDQFLRLNPRHQVITKTDLAKVENCFALLPDTACRGAEKSFTAFAERITAEWKEEAKRDSYGDNWFRAAVARTIVFRAAERIVSEADWYEGGYRAQIVAYAVARLARLAQDRSAGGTLDYSQIWAGQSAGELLSRQMLLIAEAMNEVLRNPSPAGLNISEWAKQQACSKRALETPVAEVPGLSGLLASADAAKDDRRQDRFNGDVQSGLEAVRSVLERPDGFWADVSRFARGRNLLGTHDQRALWPVLQAQKAVPSDRQAQRLLDLLQRCVDEGFEA